jgi:PhnO protein
MRFREATKTDFEFCLPLFQQLWPALRITGIDVNIQTVTKIKEVFYRLLNNPNTRMILAEDDEQIVALIDVNYRESLFYQGWVMIIEDLIVDENYRLKGIGTQLVRLAENIARQQGCLNIELNSDLYRKETHRFWEAIGYERNAYQFRKTLL